MDAEKMEYLGMDKVVQVMAMKAAETADRFIFETVLPFCQENYQGELKKEDLSRALGLLKAQEPRVLTAEELKEYLMINDSGLLSHEQWRELSQRAPLYMEFRKPDEYQVNWRTVEQLRPWAMESMFWEKYKIDRRCWSARPTEEQRKAVKWDG